MSIFSFVRDPFELDLLEEARRGISLTASNIANAFSNQFLPLASNVASDAGELGARALVYGIDKAVDSKDWVQSNIHDPILESRAYNTPILAVPGRDPITLRGVEEGIYNRGKDAVNAFLWVMELGNKYFTRPGGGTLAQRDVDPRAFNPDPRVQVDNLIHLFRDLKENPEDIPRVLGLASFTPGGLGLFVEAARRRSLSDRIGEENFQRVKDASSKTEAFNIAFEDDPIGKLIFEITYDPMNALSVARGAGLLARAGKAADTVGTARQVTRAAESADTLRDLGRATEGLSAVRAGATTGDLARFAGRAGEVANDFLYYFSKGFDDISALPVKGVLRLGEKVGDVTRLTDLSPRGQVLRLANQTQRAIEQARAAGDDLFQGFGPRSAVDSAPTARQAINRIDRTLNPESAQGATLLTHSQGPTYSHGVMQVTPPVEPPKTSGEAIDLLRQVIKEHHHQPGAVRGVTDYMDEELILETLDKLDTHIITGWGPNTEYRRVREALVEALDQLTSPDELHRLGPKELYQHFNQRVESYAPYRLVDAELDRLHTNALVDVLAEASIQGDLRTMRVADRALKRRGVTVALDKEAVRNLNIPHTEQLSLGKAFDDLANLEDRSTMRLLDGRFVEPRWAQNVPGTGLPQAPQAPPQREVLRRTPTGARTARRTRSAQAIAEEFSQTVQQGRTTAPPAQLTNDARVVDEAGNIASPTSRDPSARVIDDEGNVRPLGDEAPTPARQGVGRQAQTDPNVSRTSPSESPTNFMARPASEVSDEARDQAVKQMVERGIDRSLAKAIAKPDLTLEMVASDVKTNFRHAERATQGAANPDTAFTDIEQIIGRKTGQENIPGSIEQYRALGLDPGSDPRWDYVYHDLASYFGVDTGRPSKLGNFPRAENSTKLYNKYYDKLREHGFISKTPKPVIPHEEVSEIFFRVTDPEARLREGQRLLEKYSQPSDEARRFIYPRSRRFEEILFTDPRFQRFELTHFKEPRFRRFGEINFTDPRFRRFVGDPRAPQASQTPPRAPQAPQAPQAPSQAPSRVVMSKTGYTDEAMETWKRVSKLPSVSKFLDENEGAWKKLKDLEDAIVRAEPDAFDRVTNREEWLEAVKRYSPQLEKEARALVEKWGIPGTEEAIRLRDARLLNTVVEDLNKEFGLTGRTNWLNREYNWLLSAIRAANLMTIRYLVQNHIDELVKTINEGLPVAQVYRQLFAKVRGFTTPVSEGLAEYGVLAIPEEWSGSVVRKISRETPAKTVEEFRADSPLRRIPVLGRPLGFMDESRRSIDIAQTEAFRESAGLVGFQRGINERLDAFVDIVAKYGDDPKWRQLAGELRELEGKFSAYDVRQWVRAIADPGSNAAEELAGTWQRVINESLEDGTKLANKAHFDYSDIRNFDEWVGKVSLFHFWASRNIPYYLATFAEKPALLRTLLDYKRVSREEQERTGYPLRMQGKLVRIPLPTMLALVLFGDDMMVAFDPMVALSIYDQTRSRGMDQESETLAGSAYNFAQQMGFAPNPVIRDFLTVVGAKTPITDLPVVGKPFAEISRQEYPTTWFRYTGVIDNLLGVNLESWRQEPLRRIQGDERESMSGNLIRDYQINKRIRERAYRDTGNPHADRYQAAMGTPNTEVYRDAARSVRVENILRDFYSLLSPFPISTMTGTEQQARRAMRSTRDLDLSPTTRQTMLRYNDPATMYWSIPSDRREAEIRGAQAMLRHVGKNQTFNAAFMSKLMEVFPEYQKYEAWKQAQPPGSNVSVNAYLGNLADRDEINSVIQDLRSRGVSDEEIRRWMESEGIQSLYDLTPQRLKMMRERLLKR